MLSSMRRAAAAVVALAALGLGGAAVADATSKTASGGTATRHDRPQREALSADVAGKVKAAALAEVPGATVLRTEAGGPENSPYHAHIKTSDGKLEVVLVDASFKATAVQADRGPGRGGPHGRHAAETPLTGDTKSKVEAAVLAKYPNATIERTETNSDGSAPYESHIKTSDGTELEVHVSQGFQIVDAQAHPAHP